MKNLIILFFAFTLCVHAQTKELSGRILNLSDRSPVGFANVSIQGKNIGTTADQNGSFSLKADLSSGDILVIKHVGFESKTLNLAEFINSPKHEIFLTSKIITSQTILVKGSIGEKGVTPLTFSKLDQSTIRKTYTDQDIPEMLSYLPSTSFYSENGNGIGYNYLSIRGFDQRRISVSINGIPQNDPEDHNVYWIDFPDLLESTELIQVQRGAGSGIVGYPAVGGSINIITSAFSDKPRMEFSSSIGSFNTRKYIAEYSSGLISDKYSFYAKVSQILSSGYRNSAWVDLKSYHLSAVRYDDNLTSQINIYGGPIGDGLAYTGLPKFAIGDKTLRRANYSDWGEAGGQYTYTVERRPSEIENFSQPHFELLNELKLSDNVTLNSALFLVLGSGYFDYDGSWADTSYFRLTQQYGFHPTQNPSNAMIRAMVDNRQWGWIPRVSIKHYNGELILGGELRVHRSNHWGSIVYADNLPSDLSENFRFYSYQGGKDIINFFAHENYEVNERTNILAEAQLAYNKYYLYNEKFVNTDFTVPNLFFNPRIGINYKYSTEWSSYLSFARVSREPRLTNYYNADESSYGEVPQFAKNADGSYNFSDPLVKPETMNDLELGTSYIRKGFNLSLTFYYMLFDNEIVSQGQVDQFGQPITGNMERTIHYGGELSLGYKLNDNIELILNGSASKNYISKGRTFVSFTDAATGDEHVFDIDLTNNSISGFPGATVNGIVKLNYDNLFVQLSGKFVGSFYTDNYGANLPSINAMYPGLTGYPDNKVDSYFVANIFASYGFAWEPVAKELKIFLQVNNLFDNLYAAYGIGKEFFPAAGRNFLCGIKLGL